MNAYLARRLLASLLLLFCASILIFVVLRMTPGDPVLMVYAHGGVPLQKEEQQRLLMELGLARPVHEQYLLWLAKVIRLDFGQSFVTKAPVIDYIRGRMPATAELALLTTMIGSVIGIITGTLSAWRRDTWVDYVVRTITIGGLAIPVFWIGQMTLLAMVGIWRWSPPLVYEGPFSNLGEHVKIMVWPVLILAFSMAAFVGRATRSAVLDALNGDYARTARAKGLRERVVFVRHVLRNALIPVITVAGVFFALLLGGAVVMERVFNVPGIGDALVRSIEQRDYAVTQGLLLTVAFAVIAVNLVVDVLYVYVDPRIRCG